MIQPWAAAEFPRQLEDFHCELVALKLERTFWEKATILHAEYHRTAEKPIRDRFSRHYSDMAALASHAITPIALSRHDLRQRVVDWKNRFFATSWARYELAVPGTFHVAPPEFRRTELKKDYQAMRDMFLNPPPSFEKILETLQLLENRINRIA